MHQHQCVKCKITYQDSDPEAYYCGSCLKEKHRIASEVDKKMLGRVSERTESGFAEYDRLQKEAQARGQRFPSINDL